MSARSSASGRRRRCVSIRTDRRRRTPPPPRALGGDLVIIHPTWAWIEAQKQSGRADIFRFRFDRAPLTPQGWFGERDSRDAGAFHAGELLYVFDNLHAFPWVIDDADRALAKLASSYWINFVMNGDPNGAACRAGPPIAATAPR